MTKPLTAASIGGVVLAAHVALSSLTGAAQGRPADIRPEPLTPPVAANSVEPYLAVEGDRALLSWLETSGEKATLKFSERTATGWSEPRVVVSGDNLMVNSSDVPSVRPLADGSLVAQWLLKNGPNPEVYNLRLAWSRDNGATWSKAISPHHDGTKTQHGFATLFQMPQAGLGMVWLDGRGTNPDVEEGPGAGNMALRFTSFGKDGTQRPDVAIDTRVCECCSTDVAITSEGPIVAYRDRSAKEVRDIYVSRLDKGKWSKPVSVHDDGWTIKACPVNGPALSARGREVAVGWFTAKGSDGQVFVAFSQDAGRTWGAPIRVDEVNAAGRVGIALVAPGRAVVSWIEYGGGKSEFKTRRVSQNGERSEAVRIGPSAGTRHPRLVQHGDELLFAWTELVNNAFYVRMARAAVPK